MPNKTIYVSQNDLPVFEEAQQIAGEALSSVIARALREYVARHREKEKDMKEVSVKVGKKKIEREQRFMAAEAGKWKGLSDDKEWWLEAAIYRTQKGRWAVYLDYKGMAMLTRKSWQEAAWEVEDQRHAELVVGDKIDDFKGKLPEALIRHIASIAEREKNPIDYLDI
jgi:EXLDI family protein